MTTNRKALTHESFLRASFQALAEAVMGHHTTQQERLLEIAERIGRELEPTALMAGKKRE